MKKQQRRLALGGVLILLVFMLGGCDDTVNSAYRDTTLTGQVTEMDGKEITLQLGELVEDPGGDNAFRPKPEGDDGSTPPEAPPDGAAPPSDSHDRGEVAEPPATTLPNGGSDTAEEPPEAPPADDASMPPTGKPAPSFVAGEETATFTLADTTAITLEGQADSSGSLTDVEVGAVVVARFDANGTVTTLTVKEVSSGGPGGFGGSATVTNGTSVVTISEDATIDGETYTSEGDDENALRIDGATVTLQNITVNKTGGDSSNTENGDFYGQNAGLLVLNGAQVTITGANVTTNAKNGNGVFSYGEGTVITISDSVIRTSADNSGGIQTTGGGTTYATNLDIETQGNSAAAIRTDRGGGTVVVQDGVYVSKGTGSPAIYSTADVQVTDATLTAQASEGVVVEGKNSVSLNNCQLTGNMQGTYQGDETEHIHNIMLYQSMSGDADVGTSSFTAQGGSIVAQAGDMFYVTNTHSVINLSGVALTLANENLLTVAGNNASRGWGQAGANGGQVEFVADGQELSGNITVDEISTLDFTLANGSIFTGLIQIVPNAEGGEAVSNNVVVTIDEGCTWTLTGDATITSLTNNGTLNCNGYTLTLADGTVIQ